MTQQATCPAPRKRLAWLDIAKGIAIIAVIVGHTVPMGSTARAFIFSFHMPLFFILAGYTIKPASGASLKAATLKDARRLLVPVAVMLVLFCVTDIIFDGQSVTGQLLVIPSRIFWANGVTYQLGSITLHGMGAMWFMVALFWGKLCYRVALDKVTSYRPMLLVGLSMVSMAIGSVAGLPHSIDLLPVIMLFMEAGHAYRERGDEVDGKPWQIAGLVAALVWLTLTVEHGVFIEMASRDFNGGALSILTGILGTLVVVQFSKAIEGLPWSKPCDWLAWIGRNSMYLLCIHGLDHLWKGVWTVSLVPADSTYAWINLLITCTVQVVIDLVILTAFVWAKEHIGAWLSRRKTA